MILSRNRTDRATGFVFIYKLIGWESKIRRCLPAGLKPEETADQFPIRVRRARRSARSRARRLISLGFS